MVPIHVLARADAHAHHAYARCTSGQCGIAPAISVDRPPTRPQPSHQQWAQAKDQAKAKSKSKDPFELVMAEACGHVASAAESGAPPPDFLARALKCKLLLHRREALAQMASAASGGDAPSTRDTKSAAKKSAGKPASGKKGAKGAPVDGPGKKASTMVKRSDVRPDTKGV